MLIKKLFGSQIFQYLCVYLHTVHTVIVLYCIVFECLCAGACLPLYIHIFFAVCVCMFSCVCVREREREGLLRSHWVNAWPCLTDWVSNSWQGKLFSALKPIYTTIQASLMSALKSTTNSPWRKSLAHRGCSGCLNVRVYVRALLGMCENVCIYVYTYIQNVCVCSPSEFSFMMTNDFFFFHLIFPDTSISFMSICSHIWGAGFVLVSF